MNSKEIDKNSCRGGAFQTMLDLLEEKGYLYMMPFDYQTFVAYISGYDHALQNTGLSSEINPFQDWLHKRIGHHCSLHWSAVIRDLFAEGDPDIAMRKFFELYREFAGSNNQF